MKKIAFAFLAAMTVLSFAGCKKKGGTGDAIAKMEGFRDEACACKDKACADAVSKKMDDWAKAQPQGDKAPKPNEADMKKLTDIGTKLGECIAKHSMPPTPDPAAGGTPPAGGETPPAGGAAPAGGETPPAGGAAPAGGSADGSAAAPAGGTAPAGSGSN